MGTRRAAALAISIIDVGATPPLNCVGTAGAPPIGPCTSTFSNTKLLASPHTPFPLPSASPPPPPHHHRYVTWQRVHVASPDQDGQTVDAMGGVACTPCDSDHRPDLEDEEDEQPTSAAPCRLPWLASSRRDPPLRVLRLLASPREIHGQA